MNAREREPVLRRVHPLWKLPEDDAVPGDVIHRLQSDGEYERWVYTADREWKANHPVTHLEWRIAAMQAVGQAMTPSNALMAAVLEAAHSVAPWVLAMEYPWSPDVLPGEDKPVPLSVIQVQTGEAIWREALWNRAIPLSLPQHQQVPFAPHIAPESNRTVIGDDGSELVVAKDGWTYWRVTLGCRPSPLEAS